MRGHRGERERAGTRLTPDAGAGQAGGEGDVVRADVERGDDARRDRGETGGKIGGVDAGPAQGGVGGEGHRAGTARAGSEGERAAHEAEPAGEGARAGEGQRARAGRGHALGAGDRRAEGAVARGRVEAEEGTGGEVAAGERGRDLGLRRRGAEGERRAGGDGPAAGSAEAAEGVARGDGQYAGIDGRDAGEARGGAGERERAGADLGQAAGSGEDAAGGTGGEFQRAGGDRQRAERRGSVQADRTCAGLGERAGGRDGAGYGQGDADRDVERAAGGADRQPTTGGQGEGSGGLQAAADEVQVVGVERARHAAQGGVHRDRQQAAGEDGATPISVAGRGDAHGVHRGERERAVAFLTEGEVTVERAGERGRGGLADRERVQREAGIGHAAGGAGERGDALVVAVEVEDAAGGREDQSGRDRKGVGAADLEDAVLDAGQALISAGAGEQDHVLTDLGQAARSGDRTVDLEIRAADAGVVGIARLGLVELTLVVDTGEIPDAVAAARIGLAEEGVRSETERDAGAELLDDGDVVPVARDITHDRTAGEGDGFAAGLAAHDLQVDAGRQDVVARAGAVDGPTLEGAGLLDEGRRGRPAGHREFQRPALLDRGGHAGGAERARMRDADGAFADEERTGAVEGRAVVAEGEDAVAELAEVEQPLVVEAAGAGARAELQAGGRAGAEGAGFDEDLVMVVQGDRARAQRGAGAVHLHQQRAGLADAGDGVGRAQVQGRDLLETVIGQDAVDAVIVVGRDRPARPGEEIRRAAVEVIPDLGEGEGIVAVVHAAPHQGDRARARRARREELDAAAVDGPVAGELRLVGPEVQEGRAGLGELGGEDAAVELQGVVGRPDEGLAGAVTGGAEVKVGVDGRRVARLQQAAATEGDAVEPAVRADVDVAVGAERMEVEVGAERGGRGAEAEDRGAVVRGDRQRAAGRGDIIGGRAAGRDRDEAEGGVILEELVADALGDPRRHHAVGHQSRPVGRQEAHRRGAARGAEARRSVRVGVHPRHHEGAGADARDVAGDEFGEEGATTADEDLGTAGHGERAHGLGIIGARGVVAVELEDGGVERDGRGVGPAALGRGGGQRRAVVEADAGARMEDPGVGVGVGRTSRGAVAAFDAHLAEDVDQARAEAGTEGGGRRLAALQDQDGPTVAVRVARTGHERAAAEGVRRVGPQDEAGLAEAGIGDADHEGIAGAGQLRAGGRRIQRQRTGPAAQEELGAAGAPRGETRGRKRPAGVGTEVPVAATETGHVGRDRERGADVEGQHAGAGADHREPVVEVVEPRLTGSGADAERGEVEGARGPHLERGAAEVGGGTQAEEGRRVDDHGGAGGAQGRGVLVDADGALLDVEAAGPTRIGGIVVEVIIPDARLGQTSGAFQHVPVEDVRLVVIEHRAVADDHLAFEIVVVAEGVGGETQLRRVDRAEGVGPVVRADREVGRVAAPVAVGDDGDRAAEDEVLARGGEIGPHVVVAEPQRAVVQEPVARAEEVVAVVALAADLTALEGDGAREAGVVALELEEAVAGLDDGRGPADLTAQGHETGPALAVGPAAFDAEGDRRGPSQRRGAGDHEIVVVGVVAVGGVAEDQRSPLGRRGAVDRQRGDGVRPGDIEGTDVDRLAEDPGVRDVGQHADPVGGPVRVGIGRAETQLGHLAAVVVVEPVAAEGDRRRARRTDAVEIEQSPVELDGPGDRVRRVGELERPVAGGGEPRGGDLAAHARDEPVAAEVDHAFDGGRAVAEVKGGGAEIDAAAAVRVDRDEAAAADIDLSAGEGRLVVAGAGLHPEGVDIDRARQRGVGGAADEVRHRRRSQAGEESRPGGGITGREGTRERGVLDAVDVGIGEEAVARRIEHPDRQESLGVAQRGTALDEQFLALQVDAAELVGVLADGEGGLAFADQAGGGEDDLSVGAVALEVDRGALAGRDDPDFFAGDASRGVDEVDGGAAQEHRRRVTPLVLGDRGRQV